MTVPRVFVASSSEGLTVVETAHKLLQQALGEMAEVRPWPKEFELNKTYIESLERLLDASDFSVLVLTPDDRTMSRNAEQLSPRDNVVFELGLFFGRLGRERCFILRPRNLDLKLPSDLLGIETAQFSTSVAPLETALEAACSRIAFAVKDAMRRLPSRPKLDDESRAAQAAIRRFGDGIAGSWWEHIRFRTQSALSLVEIMLDERHSSIRLEGDAFDRKGIKTASWRSAAARLDGGQVLYVRECRRFDKNAPSTAWLPGLGEISFKGSGGALERGDGRFWESDESHPENTIIKLVDLRRATDESHVAKMRNGTRQDREALVNAILDSW